MPTRHLARVLACGGRRSGGIPWGADRIIALGRNLARQELAPSVGATDIFAERDETATEKIELTDGTGVDAALRCAGIGRSISTAFSIARAMPQASLA